MCPRGLAAALAATTAFAWVACGGRSSLFDGAPARGGEADASGPLDSATADIDATPPARADAAGMHDGEEVPGPESGVDAPGCSHAGPLWALRFGGAGDDSVGFVQRGTGGAFVVAGQVSGSVDLGLGVMTSSDGGFAAGIGADGQLLWVVPGGGDATPSALATYPDGAALVAGTFTQGASWGGSPAPPSPRSGFLAKLDANGSLLWLRTVTPPPLKVTGVTSAVVDGQGQAYATVFDFPDIKNGVTGPAGDETWLYKYGSDGALLWKKSFYQLGMTVVAVTSRGPVVRGVNSNGTAPPSLPTVVPGTAFLAQLDGSGQALWTITAGSPSASFTTAASASDGTVFVAANTNGPAQALGTTLDAGEAIVVAKLGIDAGVRWSDAFPWLSSGAAVPRTHAGASDGVPGGAAFVGSLYGRVDVSGRQLDAPSDGGTGFVLHVGSDASASGWILPDTDGAWPLGVAHDEGGNLVLAGRFAGRMAWCGADLTSQGGTDGFVIAVPPQ
jgi:hypothetical protein